MVLPLLLLTKLHYSILLQYRKTRNKFDDYSRQETQKCIDTVIQHGILLLSRALLRFIEKTLKTSNLNIF